MVKSPLTDQPARFLNKFDRSAIFKSYMDKLGIDVSAYFSDTEYISLYQCEQTKYRFFYPMNLDGNAAFYEKLQAFEWYYMPWKWEHQQTALLVKEGDKILEVGCAKGDFLLTLSKQKNIVAEGLELNPSAARMANEQGLNVFTETIQEFSKTHASIYDIVCSFQVLEHIADVKSFIQSQVDALKVGGKMIIAVPNNDSFIQYTNDSLLNYPPHHMGWWNYSSLRSVEKLFNVKFDQVIYEPLQDFHFDWYRHIWLTRKLKNNLIRKVFYKMRFDRFMPFIIKNNAKRIKGHSILTVYTKTGER